MGKVSRDMYKGIKVSAIIGAAGRGKRVGTTIPKQYIKIGDRTILEMSVEPFQNSSLVDQIILVCHEDYIEKTRKLCEGFSKVTKIVCGGKERQDSIRLGLEALENEEQESLVLIHDGARPYVSSDVIERVAREAEASGAAVPWVPVKDTIRVVSEGGGFSAPIDRETLRAVQTPQGFKLSLIKKAHEKAYRDGFSGTDDGSLVDYFGGKVSMVEGDDRNIKITTKEDLPENAELIESEGAKAFEPPQIRVGTGYDVHKLVEGRKLILCGVEIPWDLGLLGHSDADVAIHALMDAILGAAALGDIGKLFPDSSEEFRGISSVTLLERVMAVINEKGCFVGNTDITIVAQRPKLAPFIDEMRDNLADAMKIPRERVSVKATTTEGLGFAGKGEGIEAQAVCTIFSR